MRFPRVALVLITPLALLLLAACGNGTSNGNACDPDERSYKGTCVRSAMAEYFLCTENRGYDSSEEISGSLGGTFKVVADASLEAAAKRSRQENTPVALQIVRDCLTLVQTHPALSQAERTDAADFVRQANAVIEEFKETQGTETPAPTVTLSAQSARKGEQVTVTGAHFLANEVVNIFVHLAFVEPVQADANGAFSTTIVVPPDAPPPGMSTTISARGQDSGRPASAPFRIAP